MSSNLRVDGAVVFWTLGGWTAREAIEAGWSALPAPWGGTWGELTPPARTNEACLRDAMSILWPKQLIRPLAKRDGFAVLEETRRSDEVDTVTVAAAKVDDLGRVDLLRGHSYGVEASLREEYRRQSGLLKPGQVAAALVNVLARLSATRIRPTGGIYWLPQASLNTWQALAGVVERASVGGKNAVYQITHAFDADSIRAVRDALLAEVESEADALLREVDSGELGEAGLRNRARAAERLQEKVHEYEAILGERLDDARQIAEKAEHGATAARILATAAV
jgi:hypothetical protein